MAFEFQIRSRTFAVLIARALEGAQLTNCVSPVTGSYFDHVDPVPDAAAWRSGGSDTAILELPLDVFLVSRDELLAAADHVPPGATSPAMRPMLQITVQATQGSLVAT